MMPKNTEHNFAEKQKHIFSPWARSLCLFTYFFLQKDADALLTVFIKAREDRLHSHLAPHPAHRQLN